VGSGDICTTSCSPRFGLTEHANKEIRMLSGGQRRRLDVAIGLGGTA
jgi:ABC-type multidrug transport system ATPase subunit